MTATSIPVKLAEGTILEGTSPIVIIGPNGSGKTRFGVDLANRNQAEFVGALRNISLEDNIPMQSLEQATKELSDQISSHRSRYWRASNEINPLFSKLLVEDAESAMKVRDALLSEQQPVIEETKFMRLKAAWHEFFPGREIKFETYSPKVQTKFTSTPVVYAAKQMSDGERVALYLGARVLNTQSQLIVIDEPEVHFHSRLASRFWNTMQNFRPDIRFVYITHDLTFALSRQNAQFVIIKQDLAPEVVPLSSGFPNDLAESILGAATFSIYADRIVFCEGNESSDYSFYTSWFNTPNTAVIPVGGCKDVLQCSNVFCIEKIIAGVTAIGIVDRDYWPEEYLKSLTQSVTPLPVHELENIYCLREVFTAIGQHLSLDPPDIEQRYDKFIAQAKERFKGDVLAKQIVERFKCRCSGGLDKVTNELHVIGDLDALESQCVNAIQPSNWGFHPEAVFHEERKLLENALSSPDAMHFLTLFPGKVFLPIATKSLGLEPAAYKELVKNALVASDSSELSPLKKSLETALSNILPPR